MASWISERKLSGLQAIAGSHGVIAALALDQRNAMRNLFAKAMLVEAEKVPQEMLIQFKEAVSRVLTPHASAILLDPELGLPAAKQRARTAGLLLAYERTGYDEAVPGRLPRLLEHFSVQRLLEAGANGIKLLLYYSKMSSEAINDRKHAFVERVGAECAAAGIPFFLELVTYAEGMANQGPDFARLKPQLVADGMHEFSEPRYQVDVLKVGIPVALDYVEGSPSAGSQILFRREDALSLYRKAAERARIPFVYLSEGVSNEAFQFALKLAGEAGVPFSGVLCGRATWKDAVLVFVDNGPRALEDWLACQGVRNLENVNRCLNAAVPWFTFYEMRREKACKDPVQLQRG